MWQVNRATKASGTSSRLGILLRVVVESGTIYTVVTLITLVTFRTGSVAASGFVRDLVRASLFPARSGAMLTQAYRL